MEQYKVIKPILKGLSIKNSKKYSNKVIAKVNTILIAERNSDRIGGVVELKRKDNGLYICDLDSHTANEHCIKC